MAAADVSQGGVGEPASNAFAITPHATEELTYVTRAIYIGGAGNVDVVTLGGQAVSFTAVPVGTILPIRVKRVINTSTATFMLGLY